MCVEVGDVLGGVAADGLGVAGRAGARRQFPQYGCCAQRPSFRRKPESRGAVHGRFMPNLTTVTSLPMVMQRIQYGLFAQPHRRRIPGQIMCATPLPRPSGFRLSPE